MPRVRHKAVFCTELYGEAVPYDRRPDSVRRDGGRRHMTAPGSLLKSVASGCEPFPENRLTPAPCNSGSWPGTMAAGAREQAASCDAFVLSRRPPAPDAPLKRGISFAKIRGFKVADYNPRLAPVRGTSADAWNIAVRTRGVFTHRDDFQKPACAERGLVRTAPIISESAVAWTFLVITPATVGREESLS